MRGFLYQNGYRPQFSGHETFPLRYGWLKKAFDEIRATEEQSENKSVFSRDDSIARFGVGKNMVSSIRHWASASGMTFDTPSCGVIRTTPLANKIFPERGLDPYMEHAASLWLTHWNLVGRPDKTTWHWAFNHFTESLFHREQLVESLDRLSKERGWSRVAGSTIKNDVACFVRTYVAQQPIEGASLDDALESPLTELRLIEAVGKRDGFRFITGPKPSLGNGVLTFALIDFWLRFSNGTTLSFEAIAHEPGSPGRVFMLEENDIVDRLNTIDAVTNGALRWSETAGLEQVVRYRDLNLETALNYVDLDYGTTSRQEAA